MARRIKILVALGAAALTALAACAGRAEKPTTADQLPHVEAKAHKDYTETIEDKEAEEKINFDMIAVPGGSFRMGSPAGEKGRADDEGPQHPVTVKPFWMAKCEVSWNEFDVFQTQLEVGEPKENDRKIAADADALTGPTPPFVDKRYGHPHAKHPALCMTQHCAIEYCRWLSKQTGKTYRLPTEAEWEWACRAGTTTAYSFGDDPAALAEYAWFKDNSPTKKKLNGGTHEVGARKPNPWGLHDLHGNVMEWCLDHYYKDGYSKFPTDKFSLTPVLLPTDRKWSHVARGGHYLDAAAECRSAARRGSHPDWQKDDPQRPRSIWWLTKFDVIGFRVVRGVDDPAALKEFRSRVTRKSPDD